VSTIRKLLKYWGTEQVDGVSVMKQRKFYYPTSHAITNEKLFRMLNMYEDVTTTEMEGIKSAWIYFNKSKENATEYYEDINGFVVHNLNLMWWDPADGARPENLTLTTDIVIEGEFQNNNTGSDESETVSLTNYLSFSDSLENLVNSIINYYESIWNTALISQQGVGVINKGSITNPVTKVVLPDEDDLSPNDPWLATIARYALRTNGIPCTIKNVEVGMAKTESSPFYNTYVITLEIPYIEFTTDMGIIDDIAADIIDDTYNSKNGNKLTYSNGYYTKQTIRRLNSDDLELDPNLLTRPYMFWSEITAGSYEPIWYKQDGFSTTVSNKTYFTSANYYIKAGVLENPRDYGLTYKELVNYLLPLLDTDYQKKKAKWWKKLIAAVVFIIAVVLAYPSGGGSLALAKAILVGVLVITALSFVLAQMGMTEWAMAFAEVNKMVEPLVWVATIAIIWTGITAAYNAAQSAAQSAAATAARTTAMELGVGTSQAAAAASAQVTAVDVLIDMAKNVIMEQFDLLAGGIDFSTIEGLGQGMKLLTKISKIFNTIQELKLESINERNQDLAAEYKKLAEESALENDVLRGFANIQASPATADWSMYSGLFDVPYEGTGGPLHTGNVLCTTKQAIRKTKYDSPIFKDILII
jgi:hypothetical protein